MSATIARRYFARGKEQLRAGELEGATQSFAAAVELAPHFPEARVGAALTLARTDPPRAAQLLRNGLRTTTRPNPRRLILVALGDVLTAAGDFPGADEAYAEAARLPGRHPLATRLARLHAKTGRYAEAFAALAAVVAPPSQPPPSQPPRE
jgi:thioredoxin-like negative regulator of GroEL